MNQIQLCGSFRPLLLWMLIAGSATILVASFNNDLHGQTAWKGNQTETVVWDSVIQISNGSIPSESPEVSASGGYVHIFWTDTLPPYGSVNYRRSIDSGQAFSAQRTLIKPSASGGWVTPESFVFASSGTNVYLTTTELITDSAGQRHNYLSLMRSTTGGATWSPLMRFSSCEGFCFTEPFGLATRGDSLYQLITHWAVSDTLSAYRVIESSNGGGTWNPPGLISPSDGNARLFVGSNGVHFICDDPYDEILYLHGDYTGVSWQDSILLSTPGGTSDEPVIAGNENGNIYVAWRDDEFGASCDDWFASVLFRRSTDNGITWETEQVLTDTPTADHPVIAAEGSSVAVAWNNCNDPNPLNSLMKVSSDGGQSWSPAIPINQHGEEIRIALRNSIVHAAWFDRVTSSPSQVYYRRGIVSDVTAVSDQMTQPATFHLFQNYPNPFNPSTVIEYSLAHASPVTLILYDLLGERLSVLADGLQSAGLHRVTLESEMLSSGVYYYRLQAGSISQTKRLLLLR